MAAGSTVHLGNGRSATVPAAVKSLYYTSAGTVVRTGRTEHTDEPDSSYALVTDDGAVHSLGLELGDRVPGTDPTLPYLAYAERRGDSQDAWTVVLRDVRTTERVVSVPVDGAFTWGGWSAPPVALDGDHVYVALDDVALDVDWRTGAVGEAPHVPVATFPAVVAGREVVEDGHGRPDRVVDAVTGETLTPLAAGPGTDPEAGPAGASLSPDGRYALLVPWRTCDDDACVYDHPVTQVLDVDGAGTAARVDVRLGDQTGWTPDGRLIRVTGRAVDLCSPATGSCTPTGISLGAGSVKVGGSSYES